ncbi:helix-turn-helix domain-containing protein [Paenibacillus graminis]|uniref:helix-turn-helix domain-containing protein n=1 Tax=Paenibacillus graminis TaxID=189425 RepID=UPI0009DE6CB4|nr:helix-turn-helix transcriptional regulator [Paenibacillus graminis]
MALLQGKCLLRDLRESVGFTQADLSTQLMDLYGVSISTSHLSRIERGERPMTTLQKRAVCLVLNCTERDLYEWILT